MTSEDLSLLDEREREALQSALNCGCQTCKDYVALLSKVARLRKELEQSKAELAQANETISRLVNRKGITI